MQPMNYQIDVESPFKQAVGGYQIGAGIQEMQAKRQMAEIQRQQQLQMQQDLAALAQNPNPTARDYSAMMTRYPQLSEHLKKGFEILEPSQKQSRLNSATQVYAAINAGANDVAIKLLTDEAEAFRNSGKEADAKAAETTARLIEMNPGSAKATMGLMLSSIAGADKFATMFPALGKESRDAANAPAVEAKTVADARKAQVEAKYADSKAMQDLAKGGWDIARIENDIDISRQTARLNAMKATLQQEENALKRQELELKIAEATRKREDSITEKAATIEGARFNMDNMLNTIDRIIDNPALKDVVGSFEGGAMYPNAAAALASRAANITNPLYTPTSADQRNDAIRLIETLGSQAFLSQIPQIKGTGALSNAEGDKLQSAFQNFNRAQSEPQFMANLHEAQRLILKARRNLTKSGVPDTKPDRPAAENRPAPAWMEYK